MGGFQTKAVVLMKKGTAMGQIKIENVGLTIGKAVILEEVTALFPGGEITGLVGRNGSGKSMLFKCIAGFVRPTQGEITIDGVNYHAARKFPPDLGFIIESPGFLPDLNAYDNLARLAAINQRVKPERIREYIALVGLDPKSRKKVGKFSLGMKQRLGIAQAIMEDPAYLVLDEPFNGLDNAGVEDIRILLQNLREQGKTLVLASHNPLDISILCDRVYEMDRGRIKRLL